MTGRPLRNLPPVLIGTAAVRAAMLLLLPLYARTFAPADFGALELALAVALLAIAMLSAQVPEAFLVVYSRTPRPAAATAAALTLIGSTAAMVLALVGSAVADAPLHLLAAGAYVTSTIAWQFTRNLLRISGQFWAVARAELLQAAVLPVASTGLILGANLGLAGALAGLALGNLAALLHAVLRGGVLNSHALAYDASREALGLILTVAGRLMPNVLIWWAIEMLDRIILAYYHGEAAVAAFAAAARVAGLLMVVSLMLFQAWQVPAVVALQRTPPDYRFFHDSFRWYATLVLVAGSALVTVSGPLLGLLFGEQYAGSVQYVALLAPAGALCALCYFFGITYYVPEARTYALRTSLAGLVVSVALNLLLIPRWGPMGAAVSSLAAFATMCVVRYAASRDPLQLALRPAVVWPALLFAAQCIALYAGVPSPWLFLATLALCLVFRKDMRAISHLVHSNLAREGRP